MIKNDLKPIKKKHKEYISSIIDTVYSKVNHSSEVFNLFGLRNGYLGLSLFKNYLSVYKNDEVLADEASHLIERAFEELNNEYVSATLYTELLELGWYLELCRKKGWLDFDINSILDDIDELLFGFMDEEIAKNNFDPVTGVLSYAFYIFSRLESKPEYNLKIEKVVEFLLKISVEGENNTLYWKSKLKDDDEVYLGVSHGLAVIIIFLVKASKLNISKKLNKKINDAISKACKFIKLSEYKSHSLVFPIIKDEPLEYPTYAKSYCYGDFSTIYGLYVGYHHIKDEKGMEYAKSCMLKSFKKGFEPPFLDAGKSLLYGDAGLAMILRCMYNVANDSDLLPLYYDRIDYLIKEFNSSDTYLGYKGYWNQESPYVNYSLYEGMIGIGIELLCSIDKKNTYEHEIFFFLK